MTSQVQTKENDINEARKWALEWDKQLIEKRIEALMNESKIITQEIENLDKPTRPKED